MCGIIGYIGKKDKVLPILLEGLKNLEYRGYDSAGVAYVKDETVKIVKSSGAIVNLEKKIDLEEVSSIGIGHTRWATHGEANEVNSHPHKSGKVTIVHNGIIENYLEIKEELAEKGVKFKSETDTEVAAALLDVLYKDCEDIGKAVEAFKKRVKGSYAIAMIVDDMLGEIRIIKNMSPIVVGLKDGELYVASDIHAIIAHTKDYIILEDGESARLSFDGIVLFDKNGVEKEYVIHSYDGDASEIDKGEYEHFMLKEIHDEPDVARKILTKYIVNKEIESLPDLKEYSSVTIVACGSAMHAGLVGKYMIETHLGIPVSVEIASEFRYKRLFLGKNDVVIAISQSGETADSLAAVKIAKSRGAHTIGLVNVQESSIAREVDEVIYTLAGSEIAVATTKAYFAQCIMLMLLSLKDKVDKKMEEELLHLPVAVEKMMNEAGIYRDIAEKVYMKDDIFFIGRQIDYAICMEGSLKLKEISYIHSEAYAAGELKHGTISLISEGTPVFAVITDEEISEKTVSNIKEVASRGANVISLISKSLKIDGDSFSDEVIEIPESVGGIEALLAIMPLQFISYEVAKMRGCSIDKPRNLAKSVTVE